MTPDWSVAEVQEFVPQGFDTAHIVRLPDRGVPRRLTASHVICCGHPARSVRACNANWLGLPAR